MPSGRFPASVLILMLTIVPVFFVSAESGGGAPADGELVPLWKYPAGGELVSPPAAADNIYIYSEDRQIHAISIDGEFLWKFRLGGRPADTISVGPDGTVYACTLEGRLYAVNRSGRQLWRLDCGAEPSGPPAVSANGTVYIGLKSGVLYAVSHSGFIRWKADCGESISGSPIIDDGGAVYLITSDGLIRSYSPWGEQQWELENGSEALTYECSAAVNEHIIYTACGKTLAAVDRTGTQFWQTELPSACGGIVVFDGGLFMRLIDGSVMAVDFDGNFLWKGEGRGYSSYPVAGEAHLFMISSGRLVIMDFNGRIEGRGSIEGLTLTQPVISDELLVCGSEQWVACAFYVSDSDGSGWSQKGGGAAHTGSFGAGRWYFNEAEYLKNMDYLFLKQQLNSASVDDKMKAVKEIGERISADGTDRGERYLLHLLHLALTEGNRRLTVHVPGSYSDFPKVRREAARLIGMYGNFESVELLSSVLAEEKQYDVSAAVITALGELGTDYNYLPQWTIYNKVIKDNNGSAYDGLAAAAITAVERISDYSGSSGSGYGYRTLLSIYRGNYSSSIRKRAGEALRSIR